MVDNVRCSGKNKAELRPAAVGREDAVLMELSEPLQRIGHRKKKTLWVGEYVGLKGQHVRQTKVQVQRLWGGVCLACV